MPFGHLRLWQSHGGDVEVGGIVHLRRAAQPSVERIAPAVIAAHQRPRAAAIAFGERAGAVAADIVQRAQPALRRIGLGFSAHDEKRHAADRRHDVVAGCVQLRGVRDQLPAGCEHRFGLAPIPVFVDVAMRGQRQSVRGGLGLQRGCRGGQRLHTATGALMCGCGL